jgi:hypothetical protein
MTAAVAVVVAGPAACRSTSTEDPGSRARSSTPSPGATDPNATPRRPSFTPQEADVRIGLVDWTRDYDRGMERARRLGKPLLLHFGEHPG